MFPTRFNEIMSDIENGMFGDKEYFKPMVDSVSNMKVGRVWIWIIDSTWECYWGCFLPLISPSRSKLAILLPSGRKRLVLGGE